MKRILITILLLASAVSASAQLKKLTFYPQWTPQSQFAGFYMALEKGFFEEEGLDVTIKHVGLNSTESVQDKLYSGEAQIVGMQLMQGIVARADGRKIVNVMQLTQQSGLMCVSHGPLNAPGDLDGKKVGRWKAGYADFCEMMQYYNEVQINWIPFINGINLFVFGAVDATLCYSYSEFVLLKLAMGEISPDNCIRFSDFGYECPEDGLYVMENYYDKNKDVVDAFTRAARRGWDYVRGHKEEAVELSLRWCQDNHVTTNAAHQSMMLDEYLSLQVNPATGQPDYARVSEDIFSKVASSLLMVGYITRQPDYKEVIR